MCPNCSNGVLELILATDVDEDVMRAMSNRECRYTLYYLLDNERVSLEDLADVVTGWVAAAGKQMTTSTDRESLRISLYHQHLPLLAECGLVEFDPEEQCVARSSLFESVQNLVEASYLAEHWSDEATG